MFTGLVEEVGRIAAVERRGVGARLRIECGFSPLVMGESIATNGVCLTVTGILDGAFDADASGETLRSSTLGGLSRGSRVHLERALAVGARLGGHFVAGHVDGVGSLIAVRPEGGSQHMTFRAPDNLAKYLAPKGSIAIDGVSLTVNGVQGSDFDVMIVPHTQGETLLQEFAAGQQVNLEVDLLARYVERLLMGNAKSAADEAKEKDANLLAALKQNGFF